MQIRQGAKLDWAERVNQKADNFSAAPKSDNNSRTLPISYPMLLRPLGYPFMTYCHPKNRKKMNSRHLSLKRQRRRGLTSGTLGPLEGKLEATKSGQL